MATPLTTEYLDKTLDKKFDDYDKVIKKRFDDYDKVIKKRFDEQTKAFDNKIDELAAVIHTSIVEPFTKLFNLLIERIDGLEARVDQLQQDMKDVKLRLSIIESELENVKAKLESYAKRDKEDSDAFKTIVIKLQKRVDNLEAQVKKLKANQKQSARA